jgi:EmrB/QacA subfamily drug resistance transporter
MTQKWWILLGVSIACFLSNIDFTIVSTVLPAIQKDLSASLLQLQWVMNVFVLVVSMLMIAMGRFGDTFGQRNLLLAGVLVFGVSSLLAALAPNPTWLIIWRAFQGVGSAVIIPCSLAIITKTFSKEESGKAIGIWTAINSIGLAIGPVLGGLIVSVASWRYVFYINVPIVILSLMICWKYLAKEKPSHSIAEIDWLGFILMNLCIASLVLPIIQISSWGWGSPLTLTLLGVAFLSFVTFVFVENRVAHPMMQFDILANRQFISGTMANFCLVGIIWVVFFLFPLYLHNIRNETPFMVGIMLLAISGSVVAVSPAAGYVVDKIGAKKPILLGISLLMLSVLGASFFQLNTPAWFVIVSFLTLGIGWAFVMGPAASMAVTSVSDKFAGLSSGALWSIQNIGGALALAFAGSIFRLREHTQLAVSLQEQKVSLSQHQTSLVHSLLSNPDGIKQVLSHLSPAQHEAVLTVFKDSFMSGFGVSMWFLVGFALSTLMLVSVVLRHP